MTPPPEIEDLSISSLTANCEEHISVFCACSSVKGVRLHNEDHCLAGVIHLQDKTAAAFAFVCDGVGGSAGGEKASRIAVEQSLQSAVLLFLNHCQDSSKTLMEILTEVIKAANRAVCNYAMNNPQCAEMATTFAGVIHYNGKIAVAGVGDSRVYLYRNGLLEQLTRDDSLPQQLVDQGIITAEEAEDHPLNNVITHYLGLRETLESLTVHEYDTQIGDLILLSSDGFHKFAARAISLLFDRYGSEGITAITLQHLTSDLIEEALGKNSDDNISVALLYVSADQRQKHLRKTLSYWENGG